MGVPIFFTAEHERTSLMQAQLLERLAELQRHFGLEPSSPQKDKVVWCPKDASTRGKENVDPNVAAALTASPANSDISTCTSAQTRSFVVLPPPLPVLEGGSPHGGPLAPRPCPSRPGAKQLDPWQAAQEEADALIRQRRPAAPVPIGPPGGYEIDRGKEDAWHDGQQSQPSGQAAELCSGRRVLGPGPPRTASRERRPTGQPPLAVVVGAASGGRAIACPSAGVSANATPGDSPAQAQASRASSRASARSRTTSDPRLSRTTVRRAVEQELDAYVSQASAQSRGNPTSRPPSESRAHSGSRCSTPEASARPRGSPSSRPSSERRNHSRSRGDTPEVCLRSRSSTPNPKQNRSCPAPRMLQKSCCSTLKAVQSSGCSTPRPVQGGSGSTSSVGQHGRSISPRLTQKSRASSPRVPQSTRRATPKGDQTGNRPSPRAPLRSRSPTPDTPGGRCGVSARDLQAGASNGPRSISRLTSAPRTRPAASPGRQASPCPAPGAAGARAALASARLVAGRADSPLARVSSLRRRCAVQFDARPAARTPAASQPQESSECAGRRLAAHTAAHRNVSESG